MRISIIDLAVSVNDFCRLVFLTDILEIDSHGSCGPVGDVLSLLERLLILTERRHGIDKLWASEFDESADCP